MKKHGYKIICKFDNEVKEFFEGDFSTLNKAKEAMNKVLEELKHDGFNIESYECF